MTASNNPSISWTRLLSASSFSGAEVVRAGSDGAIYVAGYTDGNIDGQTNGGSGDAFLTKYNTDGTRAWTRLVGASSQDSAFALTIGTDDYVYLAGRTDSNLDGQTNSGDRDAFLTKYATDGTKVWTRLLGTGAIEAAFALTTGGDGAIYLAGETSGNLDGQTNSGDRDAFLTKYNADGTKVWTHLVGTGAVDGASALATGGDGAIYLAGTTYGNLDGQTHSGSGDAFLTKYNSDGTRAWTHLLGTTAGDGATALTTGTDGSI